MKLKIDVQQSTIDGLTSEGNHSQLELKETKGQLRIHQEKCEALIAELGQLKTELNANKRLMISYT